jgi:hypothetical protein
MGPSLPQQRKSGRSTAVWPRGAEIAKDGPKFDDMGAIVLIGAMSFGPWIIVEGSMPSRRAFVRAEDPFHADDDGLETPVLPFVEVAHSLLSRSTPEANGQNDHAWRPSGHRAKQKPLIRLHRRDPLI